MGMEKQGLLREEERGESSRGGVDELEQSMPYCGADGRVGLGRPSPACSQGWERGSKMRVEPETGRFGGFFPGGGQIQRHHEG